MFIFTVVDVARLLVVKSVFAFEASGAPNTSDKSVLVCDLEMVNGFFVISPFFPLENVGYEKITVPMSTLKKVCPYEKR